MKLLGHAARRLRPFARALPALLVWGTAAGCELLVEGELPSIHCQREGLSGPPDCPAGKSCVGHVCVEPPGAPMVLGSRCDDDAVCPSGSFCLDPSRFSGAGAFSVGPKRCSRPCCGSGECGAPAESLVCARAEGGGPGYCRKAAEVERAAPGTGAPGQPCAASTDCRSGLCDLAAAPATCLDSCCSDTSCAETKGACRFGARAARLGFWCSAPAGDVAYGDPCVTDDECASGLCLSVDLDGPPRCSAPCCSSPQCEPMAGRPVACADVLRGVFVRACTMVLPIGAVGEVGASCASGAECRSGLCAPPTGGEPDGQCTDTCCSDESCGAPGTFRCLPATNAPPWPLRCEHK